MFPERFARMVESERQSERKVASSRRFRASRCRIGGDCRHGSAQWCLCQQAKSPSRYNDKGLCFFRRRMAMHSNKHSPISVEIIARFGRKFCVRVRVMVPIAALVVLISTAIKLGG